MHTNWLAVDNAIRDYRAGKADQSATVSAIVRAGYNPATAAEFLRHVQNALAIVPMTFEPRET